MADPNHIGEDDATVRHDRPEAEPEFIGPYRLLSPLGEGGMGQVFVAQQKQPIRRKVALKIIKPGMDSKEVLTRFEAERQAVALMDHTNIARVYDAGTTDDGRPYFVMELVEGKPITGFCDQKKLSLRQRLDLFRQVCHAVQHAHQKGIIHRDLKPSNILVTTDPEKDDKPVPKIIDFGVAKALGSSLTENTLFTLAGQVIGTPQYMSPEQAALDANDVDTRADIYSLGVLLYELLTGRTPLEMAELRKAGLDAVLRTIREEEATRPSTRLSALENETRTDIAEARQLPPSKLTQSLRGDLDWIVMKALEKERSRRYETANAFAADIQRYLSDEPVLASPPSQAYKFRKFARRNRGPVTAAALITVAVIGAIAANLWWAHEARLESERADVARKDAEQLIDYMVGDLSGKLEKIGKLELMEDVEIAISDYFESAPGEKKENVPDRRKADSLLNQSAIFKAQGRMIKAIETVEDAIAIYEERHDREPEPFLADLTDALRALSDYQAEARESEAASKSRQLAIDLLEEAQDARALTRDELGALTRLLAAEALDLHQRVNDLDQAKERIREAVRIGHRVVKEHPDWNEGRIWFADALDSALFTFLVHLDPGMEEYQDSEMPSKILADLAAENPDDYRMHAEIVRSSVRSIRIDRRGKDLVEYLEGAKERGEIHPIDLAEQLVQHDPSNLEWKQLLADTCMRLAYGLTLTGVAADSLPYFDRGIEVTMSLLDSELGFAASHQLAALYSERGLALQNLRRKDDARADFLAGIEAFEPLMPLVPEDSDWANRLAELHFRAATVIDEPTGKRPHLETALALMLPISERMPDDSWTHRTLMYIHHGLSQVEQRDGNLAAAQAHADAALAISDHWKDTIWPWVERHAGALRNSALLARKVGDSGRALELVREELPLRKRLIPNGPRRDPGSLIQNYVSALQLSAELLAELDPGRLAEISEELPFIEEQIKTVGRKASRPDEPSHRTADLLRKLSDLHLKANNAADAEKHLLLAIAWRERLRDSEAEDSIRYLEGLGDDYRKLIDFLNQNHRKEEAISFQHKRLELYRAIADAGKIEYRPRVIDAQMAMAAAERALGDDEGALATYQEVLAFHGAAEPAEKEAWPPMTKGKPGEAAEIIGQIHEKAERWNEAEGAYQRSIELWSAPGAEAWGNIPGMLVASRPRVRLAQLYGKMGRWKDTQRQQWFQQAYDTLHPLAETGELPNMLKWVYESARNNVAPEAESE